LTILMSSMLLLGEQKTVSFSVGDSVIVLPREDFPDSLKEFSEIDPMLATILQVNGERAYVQPKMGDDPFWTDVSRLKEIDF
jgi:hypothetical protein